MSEKAALIKEMLEMQQKFQEEERAGNISSEEYFVGEYVDYRKKYNELAAKVNAMAHAEKGSHP
ncbi:MAG: hypothetical protein HUJ30_03100 [Gammaproteobacteria bacterium]|nr:hypothetical protein [Gammaproteobacteria bacterium]